MYPYKPVARQRGCGAAPCPCEGARLAATLPFMHAEIILAGLLVGVLAGLTGIGGGSLLAPGLVAFFGVRPLAAVGTALAVKAAMKSIALIQHIQAREINYKVGGFLVAAAAPAAVATVIVLIVVQHAGPTFGFSMEHLAHWLLAVVALLAGAATLLRPLYTYRFHDTELRVLASLKVRLTAVIIVGIVSGILLAVTAIGDSALTFPVLGLLYLMPAKRIAGTDTFLTAIVAASAALLQAAGGNIAWAVSGNLILGAMPGVLLGLWLARRRLLPEVVYRTVLGISVAGMGAWMLWGLSGKPSL